MVVNHSLLIPRSAERIFNLIADVRAYPDFVPGCERVIVSQDEGSQYLTDMRIGTRRLAFELKTLTRLTAPKSITVCQQTGPFKSMSIDWRLQPLALDACKVEFSLHCEFSPMLERTIGARIVERLSRDFIDAFVARAEQEASR
jgi:ribosome-associated toxin RatA of RatAB toxin-antitoxin module